MKEKEEKVHEWKCERCGARLPRRGRVWKWRYQKWDKRKPSGYYCDACADSIGYWP